MSDFLSREKRSALMSAIRSKNTEPEKYVRKRMWHNGFRYRLHVRQMPGTPDLVLRRYRTLVMVQGCFWHRHQCPKGRRYPVTNAEFWKNKLDRNLARDNVNQSQLKEEGWTVFVIWECSTREDTDALINHLRKLRCRQNSSLVNCPSREPDPARW